MGEGIISNDDNRRKKLRKKFEEATGVSAVLTLRPDEIKHPHKTFVGRYTLLLEHSVISNGEKIKEMEKELKEIKKMLQKCEKSKSSKK